jgi:aldose 1-epimerase
VWTAHEVPNGVAMILVSPDGDMGYPGALTVTATYTVDGSSFHVDIKATTDKETVLNLTNHSYFNLSGEGNGTVVHNEVQIDANQYVPVNDTQIPIGEFAPVEGTPFDFRAPHIVGQRIDTPGDHQLELGGGYDHTLVVRGVPGTLREAATVVDPHSGRTLTVETTQPGVHFYTGNSLPGTYAGSNGKVIERRGGLCLETQHFADSPNHPSFPSTSLKPGETFHETTVFTFGVNA